MTFQRCGITVAQIFIIRWCVVATISLYGDNTAGGRDLVVGITPVGNAVAVRVTGSLVSVECTVTVRVEIEIVRKTIVIYQKEEGVKKSKKSKKRVKKE